MKRPEPWYRKQNDAWYVCIDGRQTMLAKGKDNKDAAFDAFHKLMATEGRLPPVRDLSLGELCLRFLEHSRNEHKPSTIEWYRGHLESLVNYKNFAKRKAAEMTPADVLDWTSKPRLLKPSKDGKERRSRNKLGQSAKRGAISVVKAVYSWGAKNAGLPRDHPIRDMERPSMKTRRALTLGEIEAIFAVVKDEPFRDFLTALLNTGARPGEVFAVTAKQFREGIWILETHKTDGTSGNPRMIQLNETMIELTKRRCAAFPEGPIFRNGRGLPWRRQAVRSRFAVLRKNLNLDPGAVCYGLRHYFITTSLERGVPIATVAEIVGHKDTKMITSVYSHLQERRAHLKAAIEQATRAT